MERDGAVLQVAAVAAGIVALAGLGWLMGRSDSPASPQRQPRGIRSPDRELFEKELENLMDSDHSEEEKERLLLMYMQFHTHSELF